MGDMLRAWLGQSSVPGPAAPPELLKVSITCELCGHRQTMERKRARGEEIWMVCHDCEATIKAEVK